MAKVIVARAAESDLLEIWLYIAEDSIESADTYLDRITEKFELLSTQPEMGRLRPELHPDIRCMPVSSYIIFYRTRREGIEIVRVLHGARDLESAF